MIVELKDAFIYTLAIGPALCLVVFAPLWAPEYLFPIPETKSPLRPRSLNAGDAAGFLPTALIVSAISLLQVASTTSATYRLAASAAAVLLSIMIWVRSIQFVDSFSLQSKLKRATIIGFIYPMTILTASYTVATFLIILACIIKYETAVIPYIVVASWFLLLALPSCMILRRCCRHLLVQDA
ncbi:hypothetical protein Mal52_44860 [Symmachiella dynata]|uniref:Uncharacterized protein n=2 Tax=Symmachiella dynata TaxID=2527995 RepID=A0A517ZU47_9PLAN|nr:hypothetical protein Mal52_44860 [Symmachiella dynata]